MMQCNITIGVYNSALIVKRVCEPTSVPAGDFAPMTRRFQLKHRRLPAAAFYTTRRRPLASTGAERVQTEPRIHADSSAAPKGRLSQ